MRVLHLAAGNRWTGAAAPAFAEVAALRAAGIDAHYAYVGGYQLETKIGHLDWTHAVIRKAQNPYAFARSAGTIHRLVEQYGFDLLHAHLTYDDSLARLAGRGRARIARTFHSRRVLRNDPLSRALLSRTDLIFSVNADFASNPPLRGRRVFFTPPPVDRSQFSPDGPSARGLYRIPPEAKVVTAIGKLAPRRGFEEVLRTFAALRPQVDRVRLMIIGFGPHRPALEALSAELGIASDVVWAGYHEELLADHYRASDLLLFTQKGSDEGHRAVLEALSTGVPVASFPIEGIPALLDAEAVAAGWEPESLASVAAALLGRDRDTLRRVVSDRAAEFGYERAAQRLIAAYASLNATKSTV
jgi:glycosyltransferase involved in cell wall biosynthesis